MGAFPPPPDEGATLELVKRLQEGEDEAWEELYRRYHDQLLFAVRARLGIRLRGFLQSEDVFQSVAREALGALRRFEYRGPGSLQRYLKRLVVNKIRDRADTFSAAKRSGSVPLTEAMAAALPDPNTDSAGPCYFEPAAYERLERALTGLPDDLREILLLRKVEGLPSKEVAELTGRTDAAVRKAYSRALARLSTRMRELG